MQGQYFHSESPIAPQIHQNNIKLVKIFTTELNGKCVPLTVESLTQFELWLKIVLAGTFIKTPPSRQCVVKHNDNTMGGCYRTDIVLTYAGSALTSGHNRTIKTHLIDSGGPLIDERATIAAREDFAVAPRPSITSAGAHSCRPGRNTSGATSRLLLNTRSFVTDRGTLARRSEEPTLFSVRRWVFRDMIYWYCFQRGNSLCIYLFTKLLIF